MQQGGHSTAGKLSYYCPLAVYIVAELLVLPTRFELIGNNWMKSVISSGIAVGFVVLLLLLVLLSDHHYIYD